MTSNEKITQKARRLLSREPNFLGNGEVNPNGSPKAGYEPLSDTRYSRINTRKKLETKVLWPIYTAATLAATGGLLWIFTEFTN